VTCCGWHDLPQGLWIFNEYFNNIYLFKTNDGAPLTCIIQNAPETILLAILMLRIIKKAAYSVYLTIIIRILDLKSSNKEDRKVIFIRDLHNLTFKSQNLSIKGSFINVWEQNCTFKSEVYITQYCTSNSNCPIKKLHL
jgi:hypothetical protein